MSDVSPAEAAFFAALEKTDPAERAAYLNEACAGQPELRARVERLLAAHPRVGEFLNPAGAAGEPDATDSYAPPAEAAGAVVAGRYKLLQRIGEGGMGMVWMAEQTEPVKRRVAVKLIRAERGQSKTILSRFEAERQAIALMDHPHIARLLDAGTTDAGSPYFVMELVKGVPLHEFCDAHKLSISDRLQLFLQICGAVQHAHQKGIIHRDLKPSNILVESHDGKPVPKVIDFGLAKATTGLQLTEYTLFTAFGSVMGTPLYMAPEQANFNAVDVDTRADIYALGVILYELLTGTTPLSRETIKKAQLDEMLKLIREQEAPTPSSRLSTSESAPSVAANRQMEPAKLGRFVKGELDWIVLKALAKERDRRYESANGFARDVERFLNHEPVTAGPPTAAYRVRKFVRRNRPQAIAVGLVLFALVAGVIGTTLGLVQANRSAEAERLARSNAETARDAEAAAKHDADEKRRLAEQAASAEKAAKEQAQKRLAQIEKGVDLFAGMLSGINPNAEEQGGEPLYVQLRQRAEKAADALDAQAVGDPLAMARLQTVLGNTLQELGSYSKAVETLGKARATRERELGPDDPATLRTLNLLGLAYLDAGRFHEAIALLEQIRDASVRRLGIDDAATLRAFNNLAGAYQAAGRSLDAIALFEQVRDAVVNKLGADHPNTLRTLSNLAGAYRDDGRLPEAIALFERVRDAQVKRPGPDHPSTLITLNNLAAAYQAAERLPEAIALYKQVRDAWVTKLGADHPNTLVTISNLAGAYRDDGRLPEAIALFERVRDAQVKKPGADHPSTLRTLNNLALAYKKAGRISEAIALYEQVRDAWVKKLGADHPHTLISLHNLAGAYHAAGRSSEAIALCEQAATGIAKRRFQHVDAGGIIGSTITAYEQAGQLDKAEGWQRQWLAVVKQKAGADSLDYAAELAALGLNMLQQKKWADAEAILRECLAIREKKQPDAWTTFNTQSLLGTALLGPKKYADAEPLLLKGYEGMKAREKRIPPQGANRIPEAIDRLIELYTATGKPAEAAKWRAERAKSQPPIEKGPMPRERN